MAGGTVPGTTTTAMVAWPTSDELPPGPLICKNPAFAKPVMICWVCVPLSVATPCLFAIAAAITWAAACWPEIWGSSGELGRETPAGLRLVAVVVSCCSVTSPVSKNCEVRTT